MSGSTLKCPKCGHPRTGTKSCQKCGIIFEKYAAKQRRLEELELLRQEEKEQKRSNLIKVSGIGLASVAAVALGYSMFDGEESVEPEVSVSPTTNYSNPYNPYNPYETKKILPDKVKNAMKAVTFTVKNSTIDYPRNSGTGLILTRHCQAITDWNISVDRGSKSSAHRSRVDSYNSQIQQYEDAIEEKRLKFVESCTDCSREAFERTVKRERKQLKSATDGYNNAMDKYVDGIGSVFKLSASLNKNHYSARVDERNQSLGLSLIYVEDVVRCEPAKIGNSDSLKVGDKVFMMGGNGRVSDGVITRFSNSNEGFRIINHTASGSKVGGSGVSGVPLFNKEGEVLGIHIRSSGSERNAITIEDVLSDFRLPL